MKKEIGIRDQIHRRAVSSSAIRAGLLAVFLFAAAALLFSCGGGKERRFTDNYENTADARSAVTYAVDDLNRPLLTGSDKGVPQSREGKKVGIFYFLWLGEHGNQILRDNSIIEKVPGAVDSEENWMAAGGGRVNDWHFWGKPLFDYYLSSDSWVTRKHIQMLRDAGIDFVVFDTTNASIYTKNALTFMRIAHEYKKDGWDNVPQVVFYTNTRSGETMEKIYREIYEPHPELSDTWFMYEGKPLIIGDPYDVGMSPEAFDFFRIKRNQWPNEEKKNDGFPWMEFSRLYLDQAVYGTKGRKEIVNVSVAQHCTTVRFSYTAWYGDSDHSRSWRDGANHPDEYMYGYNIADQYEWALEVDPEIVFITGWNEWIAMRLSKDSDEKPIAFCDNANADNSRDIEPMEGGYGDNFYMQMISFIRRFKGVDADTSPCFKTIDIQDGFSQWNGVTAVYRDYDGDTVNRFHEKYGETGRESVADDTGRNDILEMKVCEDAGYVYFFVRTAAPIIQDDGNRLRLYIGTSGKGHGGYDFCVNYGLSDDANALVGRILPGDSFRFAEAGEAEFRVHEDMMMVKVPKSALGICSNAGIFFKWADNCGDDVFGFYKHGDAAPIGRAGFVYGKK